MRNLFIKATLSLVLTASLLSCLFNFTFEKPPEPKKQIIEASGHGIPLIIHIWGWITGWRSGGSGGSGKSPMPKPEG